MDISLKNAQAKLRRMADVGTAPPWSEVEQICATVARRVTSALNDDGHPLSLQLARMRADLQANAAPLKETPSVPAGARNPDGSRVTEQPAGTDAPSPPPLGLPDAASLLSPQPGIGSAPLRALWPTQLLLLASCNSETHHKALAEHLKTSEEALKAAADLAADRSIRRWSLLQYTARLADAIEVMFTVPVVTVLKGRNLSNGSGSVRLSPKEAAFVSTLASSHPKAVTTEFLARQDVPNPAKIKATLLKKLLKHEIILHFDSPPGAYALRTPVTVKA